ncbi:cell wall-binding repeat-containing protein [Guptibacillus hwajinpoensis]|uniref:cell wall-binding repeat-containing protein n=1 Tax=Guptibacillus hwajinpoensis TaxID=208199 RepID=UPI001CFD1F8B|nr:cell wall-binding repeat-containing protein [Pseudalkalibacillus hwajinpoensis]
MKKYAFLVMLTLFVLISSSKITLVSAQETDENVFTSRLSGSDRYETSLEIARNGWTKAPNVIIATGANFPDALSASALSKSLDAPIILTKPDLLNKDVVGELKSLGTKKAYLIGGASVINSSIESQLKSLGISTKRLGGKDRFETSLKIAKEIGVENGIIVATGMNFPDALSIAPIASSQEMPILLSRKSGLDEQMKSYLNDKKVPVSYLIGGEAALDSSLDKSLPYSKRLSGNTRYETNLAINQMFKDKIDFNRAYIATGTSFPDALSGSALASKNDAGIFLTKKEEMAKEAIDFMSDNGVNEAVILGGPNAVSTKVEGQLEKELYVHVSSVKIEQESYDVLIGETNTLMASVLPKNATNPSVSWKSSNQDVAIVDEKGTVTGKSVGSATITVTSEDGKLQATTEITVKPIPVTSVKLNKTSNTLKVGETDALIPTVSPSNATNQSVTWDSSNQDVASVDANGNVKALSVGKATIKVTTVDGSIEATYELEVEPVKVTSVTLNQYSATMIVGNSETFIATVSPENATNQKVTWTSSNTDVAKVDTEGTVTALSKGTAKITATSVDGGQEATLDLTVEPIKVESVHDLQKDVYQWDDYTLPAEVSVTMNNGTEEKKSVTWEIEGVDTSEIGSKSYQGTVEGYDKKVNLSVNVKSFEEDLFVTNRSYVLFNSYFNSYTISLKNNTQRELEVDKVEIYENGRLFSSYSKQRLSESNVPTSIYPSNSWSIGFNFRFGLSKENSYYIVYIQNNGHSVPCKYYLTSN